MLGDNTVYEGHTSPKLDMQLNHTCADRDGRRGPVIVLGKLEIQRDRPGRAYNKMLGTTLNELVHILERSSLFQLLPCNEQYIRAEASRIVEAVSGDGTTLAWTTH